MHFSSFLAPVLLLAGQMTMISAVLTPAELLNLIKEAVVDVNHDNNDALTITALNAVTKYSLILEDAVDLGNELIGDTTENQGSANLNETSENSVAVAVGGLTTDILTYYKTLQNKAPDFLDKSQKLGIVAAIAALENGAQAFLISVAGITTNTTLYANIQQQMANLVVAYGDTTAAYGDAE